MKYLNITAKESDKKDVEKLLKLAEEIKKQQEKIRTAQDKIKEMQNNYKIGKYDLNDADIKTLEEVNTANNLLIYGAEA